MTLQTLDLRSREIFRQLVETYLAYGEPVASRQLSRQLSVSLSAASVRNVMQDLESQGLLYSPHSSAGRLPTEQGLRFFVDALLEIGDLDPADRALIDAQLSENSDRSLENALQEASTVLSGLTRGAAVIVTSRENAAIKHIEFVRLDICHALAVLVGEDGSVENRIISTSPNLAPSTLSEASNYLNEHLRGHTLAEAREILQNRSRSSQAELDELTQRLIEAGLASWSGLREDVPQLIVRGQSNLLEDLTALGDLERIRSLFSDLEMQKDVADLLSRAEQGEGVRIFIGSENKLFSLSGSAMIAAPFKNSKQRIAGVLGIIGPTRLNYARVVPMVEYTAQIVARLVQGFSRERPMGG